MGDLSKLPTDWEALKVKVATVYTKAKPGAIPNYAGQLARFITDIHIGDLVVYPSRAERLIYIGRVAGSYAYERSEDPNYPNTRTVEWLNTLPRTAFSQGALYEAGSAMSLFQIKNYADEFRVAAHGQKHGPAIVTQDETVAIVAEETEATTRDFILKRLAQELKGLPLEDFVRHLLECMGYHARLTRTNEPSVDIIAHKDQLGIEPPIIKVQVKSSDYVASDKDVTALCGKLSAGEYGLFVTLGRFTTSARNYEQSRANLRLIDGDDFVDLILQHYDDFDARFKSVLPLKRVYIPVGVEAES